MDGVTVDWFMILHRGLMGLEGRQHFMWQVAFRMEQAVTVGDSC